MPLDFTLHDADHSFRVAQRAYELLEGDIAGRLTNIDAAQLLFATYLHDIGMTPGRKQADDHWKYILTADQNLLAEKEKKKLQGWLDEHWGGLVLPVDREKISLNGIKLSQEIFAYYCRYRHNDWSEDWIRSNLSDVVPPLYPNWVDDLVTLCRSHHEGLAELKERRFDPRLAGNNGECINLRYLAALLRLSDILEFDPERTPDVILNHRDISDKSKVYWQRDHAISFHIDVENHAFIFAARTPDAVIHKAVLDVVDMVNSEMATCYALERENSFRGGKITPSQRERYLWNWPSQVAIDISERDDSFVYIDGAFRPDKSKILALLSGTQLYGSVWAAVREMLQNAVDAVKEQIAHERLSKPDASDSKWEGLFAKTHKIRVAFESDGSRYYISCLDDGVGMTRSIIENHLLVSGSGSRSDLVDLERRARGCEFTVGRTGQFGIGLLSYFMLADQLSIFTRRSAEAGDPDGTGWSFHTTGIDGFGELRRESRSTKGTEVRLRVKSEVMRNGPGQFFDDLKAYLISILRFMPCSIELRNLASGGVLYEMAAGWTTTASRLREEQILESES